MDLCTDYSGCLPRSRGGCVPTTLGTWLARLHFAQDQLPQGLTSAHHGTVASLTLVLDLQAHRDHEPRRASLLEGTSEFWADRRELNGQAHLTSSQQLNSACHDESSVQC